MRRFIVGLCALAAVSTVGGPAVSAADGALKRAAPVHRDHVEAARPTQTVACLGGVLNDKSTGNYLTVADYPRYAPPALGRRAFICGDAIPPFIPWSDRNGAGQRGR